MSNNLKDDFERFKALYIEKFGPGNSPDEEVLLEVKITDAFLEVVKESEKLYEDVETYERILSWLKAYNDHAKKLSGVAREEIAKILDEPAVHLDHERRVKFRESLRAKMDSVYEFTQSMQTLRNNL